MPEKTKWSRLVVSAVPLLGLLFSGPLVMGQDSNLKSEQNDTVISATIIKDGAEPTPPFTVSNNGKDTVYLKVDTWPQFPNGKKALLDFIGGELTYPQEAKQKGTEGTVVVNFVVDQEGEVQNLEIAKSVSELLNQEAFRIVRNMPDWQLGRQSSKKVKVKLNLPIRFALENDDEQKDTN